MQHLELREAMGRTMLVSFDSITEVVVRLPKVKGYKVQVSQHGKTCNGTGAHPIEPEQTAIWDNPHKAVCASGEAGRVGLERA